MTTKPKFEEIQNMTADIKDALTGASSPASGNVFATVAELATLGFTPSVHIAATTTGPAFGVTFNFGADRKIVLMIALGHDAGGSGHSVTGAAVLDVAAGTLYSIGLDVSDQGVAIADASSPGVIDVGGGNTVDIAWTGTSLTPTHTGVGEKSFLAIAI